MLNAPFLWRQAELLAERIEREAGDDRVGDVRRAIELVKPYLEGASR